MTAGGALAARGTTVINRNASNWVDRGEPAQPKIASAIRHFLGFDVALDDARLLEYAEALMGMVAADASEIQVAAYLGYLEDAHDRPRSPAKHRRLEAIAIWHVAKAALTRDRAIGLLEGAGTGSAVEHGPLSDWLATRILAPRSEE